MVTYVAEVSTIRAIVEGTWLVNGKIMLKDRQGELYGGCDRKKLFQYNFRAPKNNRRSYAVFRYRLGESCLVTSAQASFHTPSRSPLIQNQASPYRHRDTHTRPKPNTNTRSITDSYPPNPVGRVMTCFALKGMRQNRSAKTHASASQSSVEAPRPGKPPPLISNCCAEGRWNLGINDSDRWHSHYDGLIARSSDSVPSTKYVRE